MISIQSAMLVALGFLGASLLGLLVASAFWSRAVRLTTARIKQSMPVSEPEIKADRDRLRAEYAIKVHKLETELEQAKLERARKLIDINRRDASISTLESDVMRLKADLEENQNARRVLEQTVSDQLPRVEARLNEAKRLLFNRDREIAELTAGARRHKVAMEEASAISAQQNAQIERLATSKPATGAGQAGAEGDLALRSEIEQLRGKTREQAMLIDRLQRRQGFALAAPSENDARAQGGGERTRAQHDIAEAQSAIQSARAAADGGDAAAAPHEREITALKAHTQDQAGEIARLKAALAAFEQQEAGAGGLKDTKIALRARLGAATAQADQQAGTIAKLRAELAAANERLARQAAQFMGEMRRIRTGSTAPPSGSPSRQQPRSSSRSLSERVAQASAAGSTPATSPPRVMESRRADLVMGKVRNGRSPGASVAEHPPQLISEPPGNAANGTAAAAELPNTPEIPQKRRRPSLLDRITGLGKG